MNTNTETLTAPRVNSPYSGLAFNSKQRVTGALRESIVDAISDPKGKHTRRSLKRLRAMLDRDCTFDRDEPIPAPVRFARKLTGLKLTQLFRRRRQWARRASTALHLSRKLSPESVFRNSVEQQHLASIHCFKQTTAEISARALACEGKLSEAA